MHFINDLWSTNQSTIDRRINRAHLSTIKYFRYCFFTGTMRQGWRIFSEVTYVLLPKNQDR